MARGKKGVNKRPPKLNLTKTEKVTKKYLVVPLSESIERFKEIGLMITQKKLKWSHYNIENGVGMHYYLILKR